MGIKTGPRHGSLQFWPRKRAEKFLHKVNWEYVENKVQAGKKPGFLGFIGYKAGMRSAYVKDESTSSMTKGKRIILPVTIIECPTMKIFSVRFYKNRVVKAEILNDNIDKEMIKLVKIPKSTNAKEGIEKAEKNLDFDDVRVIVYSQAKKTGIKKTPDIAEVGLRGSKEEKLRIIKENLSKEISVANVFDSGLVDVRAVTKGKGTQGPAKRFGIRLRFHKSEKGVRRVGSIGPWHPSRLTFRIAFAGQMGLFSRIAYNNQIVAIKKSSDAGIIKKDFHKYGKIKNDFIVLRGSIPGVQKRQLLISSTIMPTKRQLRRKYELIELR